MTSNKQALGFALLTGEVALLDQKITKLIQSKLLGHCGKYGK